MLSLPLPIARQSEIRHQLLWRWSHRSWYSEIVPFNFLCLFLSEFFSIFVRWCPVPGMIGTMQAMETIKLLLGGDLGPSYSGRLLVFDGESGIFRVVNLRPRQPHCAVCSGVDSRTIHRLEDVDYALFCGRGPNDKVLASSFHLFFLPLFFFFRVLSIVLGTWWPHVSFLSPILSSVSSVS